MFPNYQNVIFLLPKVFEIGLNNLCNKFNKSVSSILASNMLNNRNPNIGMFVFYSNPFLNPNYCSCWANREFIDFCLNSSSNQIDLSIGFDLSQLGKRLMSVAGMMFEGTRSIDDAFYNFLIRLLKISLDLEERYNLQLIDHHQLSHSFVYGLNLNYFLNSNSRDLWIENNIYLIQVGIVFLILNLVIV